MRLTGRFTQPFFTGGASSNQVPTTFGVAIDGHTFALEIDNSQSALLAQSRVQVGLLPALRDDQDAGATPSEQSMSNKGFWTRFQQTWRRGQGQAWFDPLDLSDRSFGGDRQRFAEGVGIDWDRDDGLSIASPTLVQGLNIADATSILVVQDRYLFIARPTKVTRVDLLTPGTTADLTLTSATTVYSITTDDDRVFIGTDHGIYSGDGTGTTFANLGASTATTQFVLFANGRLLCGQDNVLKEVSNAGVLTTVYTHRWPNFRWDHGCQAPTVTYVGGRAGAISQTFVVSVVTSDGSLSVPNACLQLPLGESLNTLISYAGLVQLGTTLGTRIAQADANGDLTYFELVKVGNVKALASRGDKVYFGWAPTSAFGSVTDMVGTIGAGLLLPGRQETQQGQPAWGPAWLGLTGTPSRVLVATSPTYLVVAADVANGLAIIKPNLLDAAGIKTAVLDTGWLNYGTPRLKQFVDVNITHSPLGAGQSITVQAVKEDGNFVTLGVSSTAGTSAPLNRFGFGPVTANRYKLVFRLDNPSGTLPLPVLYRWEMRGYPVPDRGRAEQLVLRLYPHVLVGQDERASQDLDPLAEFHFLENLVKTGKVVRIQQGNEDFIGYVSDLKMAPTGWYYNPDGSHAWFEGLAIVEIHGI